MKRTMTRTMLGGSLRAMMRALAASAVICLLTLQVPSAASAEPPADSGVVTRTGVDQFTGIFIAIDGTVVVTGPLDFADGCIGQGFQRTTFVEVARANGSVSNGLRTSNDSLAVYAADDFFTDVLIPSCEAVFDNDPTTEPVQPIAVGTANGGGSEKFAADGSYQGRFWIHGSAMTPEGDVLQVNAWTHVLDDSDGNNIRFETKINLAG